MAKNNAEHSFLENVKVEVVLLNTLKPYDNNARKHPPKQLQQIANSINKFGFLIPIIIDKNNRILCGHGRVEAAKKLGMQTATAIRHEHLTEDQIRAYIIADNQIAANAGWDNDILAIELQHLANSPEIDIEDTGFEMAEIDIIIDGTNDLQSAEEDEVPETDPDKPAITITGDLWILGQNYLFCGDSSQELSYTTVMSGSKADMIFTDPPYNVKIDGHVCGLGKVKHREFKMASGEMSPEGFIKFLITVFKLMVACSRDGSLHYIFMDWRHLLELLQAAQDIYAELKNICVWNKDNGGMGTMYRSKHEMVAVFKNGTAKHTNNIELGKHGRYRTNVWDYPGVNTMRKNRMKELAMHPTVKPVALVADAIKDCTKRGDIVLDPFGGSGTTLIAAEKTGRIARLIEIDPHYCDTIIRRWQELTGKDAVHVVTGKTFNETAAEREGGANE